MKSTDIVKERVMGNKGWWMSVRNILSRRDGPSGNREEGSVLLVE